MKQKRTNRSGFSVRFMQNTAASKNVFIFLTVLQILGLPVLVLTLRAFSASRHHSLSTIGYFAFIPWITATLAGIYTAVRSFRYLHKKPENDMALALPVKNHQRFAADYLSGLLIYITPFIAAAAAAFIIIATDRATRDLLINSFDCFPSFSAAALLFTAGVLTVMISLYTLTVFTSVCCGRLTETLVYTAVFSLALPGFIYTAGMISFRGLESVKPLKENIDALSVSSPVGEFYQLFYLISSEAPVPAFIRWLLCSFAVTAAVALFSLVLYCRRKAEDVTKPFVFMTVYRFISVITVFSAAGTAEVMFSYRRTTAVIISILVFAVMDLIMHRNQFKLRTMTVSAVCLILSVSSYLLFGTAAEKTEGFGIKEYIPEPDSIKSVSLTDFWINETLTSQLTFRDSSQFEEITSIHDDLIHKNTKNKLILNYPLIIEYTLKNGKRVYRYYYPSSDYEKRIFALFWENRDVKKQFCDSLRNDSERLRSAFDTEYYFTLADNDSKTVKTLECSEKTSNPYKQEIKNAYEEIMNAFQSDLLRIKKQNNLARTVYKISTGFNNDIYISEEYTETINAISNNIEYFS